MAHAMDLAIRGGLVVDGAGAEAFKADVGIAAGRIVEVGEIDPDQVHLPGIYVDRIVLNAHPEKRIEQRTVSK